MKLRTSFFNKTVLRNDITRFMPVWLLYLIGSLMIGMNTITGYSYGVGSQAYELAQSICGHSVINFIYALICAEMLFGDLFKSKLCNALHAMPLRRESWFLTHTIAGLAFSVVPNLILSLCFMLYLDGMWYVSLIWLLGVTLQYLFFFGVAAFSAICAGSRLGMTAIYSIINFLSVIIAWFVSQFCEPQLYGLHMRYDGFFLFCPVVWMVSLNDLVVFNITEKTYYPGFYTETVNFYTFEGLSASWWYLVIVAVLGVAFLALGVVLYRKRKLESAGDLLAFQPIKPIFAVIFTLISGVMFQLFGGTFSGGDDTIALMIGIVVGYFVCQMLMQRTVKVFRKKEFLKCGIIALVLLAIILLTAMDPIGITRWVPKADEVESIILSDDYYFELEIYEHGGYRDAMLVDNPTLIEELVDIHEQILLEDKPAEMEDIYEIYYPTDCDSVHLTYRMKDGRTVERRYFYRVDGEVARRMNQYIGAAEYVLEYDDWDTFLNNIDCAYIGWEEMAYREDAKALAEAIKADCETGYMSQNRTDYTGTIDFEMKDGSYITVNYFEDSVNTIKWLKEHHKLVE